MEFLVLLVLFGLGGIIVYNVRYHASQPPTPEAEPDPPIVEEDPLPPPTPPERPTTAPVVGIMRVDVTQTYCTVDVFIVLSEEAKFIVEKTNLGLVPIEENFEGLKQHIQEYSRYLDYADDDLDAAIAPHMDNDEQFAYYKKKC